MRLTVIGCSPAWPNPGGSQSGYLVESGGRLLLDCGPGVLARLRSEDLVGVDAIAITHFHLDHCGDLIPWAWFLKHAPVATTPPMPVLWLPPGGKEELARFAQFWGVPSMFEDVFDVAEFEASRRVPAAGFELEALPVPHYGMPAYGFRVHDRDGRILAYSGDSAPGEQLERVARGADLFLCEATLASGGDDSDPRGHLSAEEAIAAADGPVLLTHRPGELPAPAGARLAYDGLVLEI